MPIREPVIGLECHARLLTRSKMFCGCSTAYGAPPNTQTCPVCLAYPGSLPVLNRRAVELAIRVALATGCTIHETSRFARKNYFYADLPKGYQISQHEEPLATGGSVEITAGDRTKQIRILRIHLEEDAGKSIHDHDASGSVAPRSLVDLNRAGTPLIEIVSEPDLSTAEEAILYLTRLRQILMYVEACDGNMEEGSLRVDANVSVHVRGTPLGTRSEIKNLNSFRFLRRAIEFEIARQNEVLDADGAVTQETRLFDPSSGETRIMRSKEEAHDYRYFIEPDLLPLVFAPEEIADIRTQLPSLPDERISRYRHEWDVPRKDAEALVATRALADYFEETARASNNPRAAANWVKNEVLRVLNEENLAIEAFSIGADRLAELIRLIDGGTIGGKVAKDIFEEMRVSAETPETIVGRKGLLQISDRGVLREAAEKVVRAHTAQLEQYRSGRSALFGFFVGQLMKETGGKANAAIANEIIRQLLDEPSETK